MTENHSVDIVIIGSGFGGSLTALLLGRIGFRVLLLDRGQHPRFAVGESSTPIADLVLRDLASRYDLPQLLPLTRYGTWKATYPELICGVKRGFSYFAHKAGHSFEPFPDHRNELLVAASNKESLADTHWLRSDVDSFFVSQVEAAGISYLDQTNVSIVDSIPSWHLKGNRDGSTFEIYADFLIDASGETGFLPHAMNLDDASGVMRTNSRAIFAHFVGVVPWNDILRTQRANTDDHPFPCDAAALHHILEEGWMWQLRFDNGITSAGFVLDADRHPLNLDIPPEKEWDDLLNRYPSLAEQFASAKLVAPAQGLCRTGRLQRQWTQITGNNWALMPHTAGFVDPLNSTGIAHTLCGVERVVHLLEHH
ncbi:MAG: tryptophan 7-halogenase, partial [Planctomycetaceae bacterium]|nr:tryptophan 7-halogenase [Planctomycetaceae bacterium]